MAEISGVKRNTVAPRKKKQIADERPTCSRGGDPTVMDG
jgi:hypothetical protein